MDKGHQRYVDALALDMDSGTLVTGAVSRALLRDVHTGAVNGVELRHKAFVWVVNFDPTGKLVCTGSQDRTARIWDRDTGWPVGPPMLHGGTVFSCQFAPDGRTLVTGCGDFTTRVWSVPDTAYTPDRMRMRTWLAVGEKLTPTGAIAPLSLREMSDIKTALDAGEERN
jgi:WD40 repeat protein